MEDMHTDVRCEGLRVKCILVANCRYVKLTRCKLLFKNSAVGFLSHIALMQLDEKCEKSCFRCSYFLPIDSNFYLCFFFILGFNWNHLSWETSSWI